MRSHFSNNASDFAYAEQIPVIPCHRAYVVPGDIGRVEKVKPHLAAGDAQQFSQGVFHGCDGKVLKQVMHKGIVEDIIVEVVVQEIADAEVYIRKTLQRVPDILRCDVNPV